MLYGSKVTALAGLRLLTEPERVLKAQDEFRESMQGRTYECMMPDDLPAPV